MDELVLALKAAVLDCYNSLDSWSRELLPFPEFEQLMLRNSGCSYEEIAAEIAIGIQHGYSLEWQIDLLANALKKGLHG
jgi:hypothetical protein